MQDILTCVMGLDVHRDIIVACLVKGAVDAEPEAETRTFSTLIPEMQKLRDWVIEAECRNIAMESTGIYWQPIYEMLESCFDGEISILVVNARHMKNVPGRKTDMKDAQWIATLLRAGLLKGSFIPDKTFRELRHLTRYRKSVVHDITAQKNRIDKFLQSSGFRFTAFLSDTFGASGRNIIRHLIEHGSIDREALDKCLKTKTRNRIDEILVALNGSLSVHQRRFLNMVFLHLEDLEAHKHTIEDEITEEVLKHTDALNLLCSIPGIDVTAAAAIVAEIGTDMSAFPDSQHICSWTGLSPGNNESAGKRKSVHINKGNGKHGIIRFVAGVNCGNLFVPNQQECVRIVYGQTGVEYISKVFATEFGECGAVDLCAFGQRLVGRAADGIDISIQIQSKAEVGGGVFNCVLAGTCGKCCGVTIQGRSWIQWLHMKVFDLTAAPTGRHTQCLVITEHGRIVVKVCFKVVVTG